MLKGDNYASVWFQHGRLNTGEVSAKKKGLKSGWRLSALETLLLPKRKKSGDDSARQRVPVLQYGLTGAQRIGKQQQEEIHPAPGESNPQPVGCIHLGES